MMRGLAELRRKVSRSFDLSLRMLPRAMRRSVGLAYLLARASDTIADTAAVPVATRLAALEGFAGELGGGGTGWRGGLEAFGPEQTHEGERELLQRTGELFDELERLPERQAALVREVVTVIVGGQQLDLERFGGTGGVLPDEGSLEDYCYRVAGCVGVFWTRIGFETLGRRFSTHHQADLERLGASYGEGLQLVNILRDLPRDVTDGRCYLPVGPEAGQEKLLAEAAKWRDRAREGLEAGLHYGARLRTWRLRSATVLPALIGLPTLDLLDRADWDALRGGVKVDRRVVRRAIWDALCFPRE